MKYLSTDFSFRIPTFFSPPIYSISVTERSCCKFHGTVFDFLMFVQWLILVCQNGFSSWEDLSELMRWGSSGFWILLFVQYPLFWITVNFLIHVIKIFDVLYKRTVPLLHMGFGDCRSRTIRNSRPLAPWPTSTAHHLTKSITLGENWWYVTWISGMMTAIGYHRGDSALGYHRGDSFVLSFLPIMHTNFK